MFEAVVIGASAGGMQALKIILSGLPEYFPIPIAIVQHIQAQSDMYLSKYLNGHSALCVKEAEDKETLQPYRVYVAPPGYHLLVEPDRSLSLSVDEKVNYSRPAIDVLFESAADMYRASLIGIVLTGANADGALGLSRIKSKGGLAIVQDPQTAESPMMPKTAIQKTVVDHVVPLEDIATLLIHYCKRETNGTAAKN